MMRKVLLAGVAALSVLGASTAHADWITRFPLPSVPLPEEMLGDWCLLDSDKAPSKEDGVSYYARPQGEEGCLADALTVRSDGWDEVWDNCPFTKVTKEANGVYLIYSRCEILAEGNGQGIGKYFTENMEYQIIDDQLVVRRVPEL